VVDVKIGKMIASGDNKICSSSVQERQMTEISLLTNHYYGMLTASGNSCAELVTAAVNNG
jgi:hypothetical protein